MKEKSIISVALTLIMALSLWLGVPASAAQDNAVWLQTEVSGESVTVSVCANTTVSDGQISLSYDAEALTYVDIAVEEAYVLAHAANTVQSGVVKVAWIAPGDYEIEGTVHVLMRLTFTGTDGQSLRLSGRACTPDGTVITIETAERAELTAAVEAAQALRSDDYTADSFALVESALTNAQLVLADVTATQAEVDDVLAQLNAAVAALEVPKVTEPETVPTTAPDKTEPATTVPQTGPNAAEPDGGNGGLIIVIVAVCIAGAVAAVVIIRKRGSK